MKEPIQNDNKKQFLENFLKGQKTTEVYEDLSFNEILEKLNDLDFSDGRTYQIQLTAYFFKSIPLCTTPPSVFSICCQNISGRIMIIRSRVPIATV